MMQCVEPKPKHLCTNNDYLQVVRDDSSSPDRSFER